MTTQPEALRLAALLEQIDGQHWQVQDSAAAELRRLHAENERLHQINKSHEMKLSVRGYEIQIADLAAQRDALLEALKMMRDKYGEYACRVCDLADAAIAKAEAA